MCFCRLWFPSFLWRANPCLIWPSTNGLEGREIRRFAKGYVGGSEVPCAHGVWVQCELGEENKRNVQIWQCVGVSESGADSVVGSSEEAQRVGELGLCLEQVWQRAV